MASDVSDTVRNALGHVAREALKNVDMPTSGKQKSSPLSGARGLALGAGLAALAPLAKKGVDAVRVNGLVRPDPTKLADKAVSNLGDRLSSGVKDLADRTLDEAGGAGGLAKQAVSGLMPGGDGGDGGKNAMPGVGKGRRMPVQQAVDVAVPLETAYNQWTQYEDWPEFMHRVKRVTQEDPTAVTFATKIWGKTKEFTAEIVTQRPDDRVKWRVTQGITHTGVVSFHELAPRLTRMELELDVDPGSLLEKAARGMRHIKRAARADLHRYKAFIEMQEHETGAWRGRIEDGEVVEDHDESYDKEREYSEIEDIWEFEPEDSADEDDGDDEEREKGDGRPAQAERTRRFQRQAQSSRGEGSSSRSGAPPKRRPGPAKPARRPSSKPAASKPAPRGSGGPRGGAPTRRKAAGRS
jgi:uncharacterized membrane protein